MGAGECEETEVHAVMYVGSGGGGCVDLTLRCGGGGCAKKKTTSGDSRVDKVLGPLTPSSRLK
jgi:hypothetical protein